MQGQSSVREVDLKTGEVLRLASTERQDFGEGLSSIGDRYLLAHTCEPWLLAALLDVGVV